MQWHQWPTSFHPAFCKLFCRNVIRGKCTCTITTLRQVGKVQGGGIKGAAGGGGGSAAAEGLAHLSHAAYTRVALRNIKNGRQPALQPAVSEMICRVSVRGMHARSQACALCQLDHRIAPAFDLGGTEAGRGVWGLWVRGRKAATAGMLWLLGWQLPPLPPHNTSYYPLY